MQDHGKRNILGVQVDALDYEAATHKILRAAAQGQRFAVTALAVHGVMTGVENESHRYRLNQFDLVTPDGQPVRWALNLLHRVNLPDRVYGPELTLRVCTAAAREGLPVFFYGSKPETLDRLTAVLLSRIPGLIIAGTEPSLFRTTTLDEKHEIAARIRASGARVVFIGLGCPRQEVFAHEYKELLAMPIIAVGAAFDYHAGLVNEPPKWMQQAGLQWFYRLLQDPRRMWRRYLLLNPWFLVLLTMQALQVWKPDLDNVSPPQTETLYG